MPRGPVPFKEIQAAAVPHVEALCRRWLPDGRRTGGWWVCKSPFRKDTKPSFGVSISTGKFKDFANGHHGDIIDLYQQMNTVGRVEAAKAVARVVGHSFADERVA